MDQFNTCGFYTILSIIFVTMLILGLPLTMDSGSIGPPSPLILCIIPIVMFFIFLILHHNSP